MAEYIIAEGGCGKIIEKKSRFIANIQPVQSEEEAVSYIADMKKQYWDARHNCMAYIVGETKRFSDDGEPQGTAGKPMLEVMENHHLTNAVVVVTRYFGGILLGTGGLLRAYQAAVNEGLKNCVIARKCHGISAVIRTDYTGLGKIQYIAQNQSINIVDTEYLDNVSIHIVCETEQYDLFIRKVTEMTAGKAVISEDVPVTFYQSEKEIRIITSV